MRNVARNSDEDPAGVRSNRPHWRGRALHAAAHDLSGEQLRRLIDANVFGVIVSSSSGGIYEANDAFLTMVGYTRSELEAGEIDWRALTPSKWAANDDNAVREMAHSGIVSPYFKEYVHKSGRVVPISLSGVRLLGSGDRKICCIVDLSAKAEKPAAGTNVTLQDVVNATKSRYGLTNRESDILRELLRGRSNSEIAGVLHISATTVADHVCNVLRKLDVRARRQMFSKIILGGEE